MFDWNDLKAFLAVARGGSTLAAATTLKINQTTVARRLEALETALGLKLFERAQNGSRLTEAGRDLVAEAERMEQAAEGLANRAGAHRRGMAGTLRVTSIEVLANLLITPSLVEFRRLYPDIRVDLVITDEMLDLQAGEADIAIRTGDALADSDLVARKLGEFEFALYASRDYLLRRGMPRSLEDLRNHDLIGDGDGARPLPALSWLQARLPDVEPVARSNSLTNLLAAIRGGLGVAPVGCLAADLEPDLIRCLPIPEIRPAAWAVTRGELKDQPRIRAFMDFIVPYYRTEARELGARGEALQAQRSAELTAALAEARGARP